MLFRSAYVISKFLKMKKQQSGEQRSEFDEFEEKLDPSGTLIDMLTVFHNFDFDGYLAMAERVELAERVMGSYRSRGLYVQENLAGEIYAFDAERNYEANPAWDHYPQGLEDPIMPEWIRERLQMLTSVGVGHYVDGVGVMTVDNKEYKSVYGRAFYLEKLSEVVGVHVTNKDPNYLIESIAQILKKTD